MADIIIPVYNGIEETEKCIKSVIANTDLKKHHLILINDASPDEAVLPMLKSYADSNEGITLLDNEENLGFPGTVNRGLEYSNEDVLLLNSDTIVTRRWMEKIIACAYSAVEIATVTPLSNAATLASVPYTCVDNKLPDGYSPELMNVIVEAVSIKKYPRVPVGVGFCFFIKRSVIDEVGLLDAATYEKGYGEENDFCHRATIMGYSHVLCDDTFIYHSGTASFVPEQKKRLVEDHAKILEARYPKQIKMQNDYLQRNPDEDIRARIRSMLAYNPGKKTCFFLSHMDFREDIDSAKGGVQYHIKDLTDGLKEEYNVLVGSRDGGDLLLTIYNGDQCSDMRFPISAMAEKTEFRNKKLASIFRSILDGFDVAFVHVHHTYGLSLDIFYEAAAKKIPVFATIHDYYYACPNIKLFKKNGEFCGYKDDEECKNCLGLTCGINPLCDYKKIWQKEHLAALELCDKLFVPSNSGREIFLKAYPTLENKCVVIEHGISELVSLVEKESVDDLKKRIMIAPFSDVVSHVDFCCDGLYKNCVQGWSYVKGKEGKTKGFIVDISFGDGRRIVRRAYPQSRKDLSDAFGPTMLKAGFKVLFSDEEIGKGKRATMRVYHEMEDGSIVADKKLCYLNFPQRKVPLNVLRVAYIGGVTPEKGSAQALEMVKKTTTENIFWYFIGDIREPELSDGKWKNVIGFSEYKREALKDIVDKLGIDIIVILPQWAETYCYTVSEALSLGIPVITTNIGAIGERMQGKESVKLVDVNNAAGEALDILRKIYADISRSVLNDMKQAAAAEIIKTVPAMNEEYKAIYTNARGYELSTTVLAQAKNQTMDESMSLVLSAMCYGEGMPSKDFSVELLEKESEQKRFFEKELIKINSSKSYRVYNGFINLLRRIKRKIKGIG